MTYTDLTDEEYDALDEELTRTVPQFGPSGSDWLVQRELRHLGLSKLSTDYLLAKAASQKLTPAQIIDELIQEKVLPTSA
jgi:hypothetical protein